ncbi:MAG: GNAT family N-acetyltransferase [Candidatus Promineifilaceae bacterium]
MNIRPFDYSTADYERYVALRNSINVDQPASVAFEQRFDSEWPDDLLHVRLLIDGEDGRLLAGAEYNHLLWSNEPRKFGFMIYVREDARRQGLGNRLYRHILQSLAGQRPTGFETMTREDWPDGIRFLEKRGFHVVNRQQQSQLDPAAFDAASFSAETEAAAASGITLKTLSEFLASEPDALRKLYDLEVEITPDVPWYSEMSIRPFEHWARAYEDNPDLLPGGYIVALDGDKVAGMSQLWGSQATDTLLYTGLTAVRAPYRGRGLATAMKARAIQFAQTLDGGDGNPPRIVTSNEASNPMLQINLRLGFQLCPAWLVYHR